MMRTEQFWGYRESVHAQYHEIAYEQYREMAGVLVMCGVRTLLDGGGYGGRSRVPLRTLHIEDGNY